MRASRVVWRAWRVGVPALLAMCSCTFDYGVLHGKANPRDAATESGVLSGGGGAPAGAGGNGAIDSTLASGGSAGSDAPNATSGSGGSRSPDAGGGIADSPLASGGSAGSDAPVATGGSGGARSPDGGGGNDASDSPLASGGSAGTDAPVATGGSGGARGPDGGGGIGASDGPRADGGSTGADAPFATGGRVTTGGAAGSGGVAGTGGLSGTGGAGTGGNGTGGAGTGGAGGTVDAGAPVSLWKLATAPVRAWTAVAYGNGTFVVVGDVTGASDEQNLITSTDGVNWTARSTGAPGDTWTTIAYGNGSFVAVGYPTTSVDAVILRSPDGASWTSVPGGWTAAYNKIAFGNDVFVLTGTQISSGGGPAYHDFFRSLDGVAWQDEKGACGSDDCTLEMSDVAFGNGTFRVLTTATSNYQEFDSTDGMTWNSVSYGNDYFQIDGRANHMIGYGNGMFLTTMYLPTSGGPNLVRLRDGDTSWTSVKTVPSLGALVGFGNNTFVVITPSWNQILVSLDSTTWPSVTSPSSTSWTSVAYGANRFVAVARDGTVMYSGAP